MVLVAVGRLNRVSLLAPARMRSSARSSRSSWAGGCSANRSAGTPCWPLLPSPPMSPSSCCTPENQNQACPRQVTSPANRQQRSYLPLTGISDGTGPTTRPAAEKQHPRGAFQRLGLGFLIDAQHDGRVRRLGYSPMTSRTLASRRRSAENLKLSARHGCSSHSDTRPRPRRWTRPARGPAADSTSASPQPLGRRL